MSQDAPSDPEPTRSREQDFHRQLLADAPGEPQESLRRLCEAWREAGRADWAWLWLHNPNSDSFELTAFSTASRVEGEEPILPAERQAPSASSIAAYCCKTGQSVYCTDFTAWRAKLDSLEYRVLTAESLEAMGCAAFECIPIRGFETGLPHRVLAAGVITLHWRDTSTRIEHAQAVLKNMARVSALFILNLQMTEQRGILVKLNRMARQYVTKPSRRPAVRRAEYLKELIELIQKHIHVARVSVFYRTPVIETVECVATTGLSDSRGNPVQETLLSRVKYAPFEGLTGCCFGSGEPILVHDARLDKRHIGKYSENRVVAPPPGSDDPCFFAPIPIHAEEQTERARCVGVIRCTEHTSPLYADKLCPFNPTELETVGFIAEQVGPVLQSFAQRIERERAVSIVKHDLAVPLVLVRDLVTGVVGALDSGSPLGDHDLEDILASNYLAINLVQQLDPEPGTIAELRKEPTLLEGSIVARLAKMLRRFARLTNNVDIHFTGFRAIPMLQIDRDQIERAIFNLVLNAVKYSRSDSRIELGGRADDIGYYVDVSNEGMGVASDDERYIFEPGFRSTTASHTAQGLGLGLTITRQIMKAHGGDVILTSAKDPTVFTLFFPRELES